MVKRLVLLAMIFCMIQKINAQVVTKGSLSVIKPGSTIGFVLDFSEAIIMGMNEENFSKYETDWYKDLPKINSNFLKGINETLDGILKIAQSNNTFYTMNVSVKSVSTQGYMLCDVMIVDNEGKSYFIAKQVNGGKEPIILPGSKLAKIKLWSTLTGRALGRIVRSEYLNQ